MNAAKSPPAAYVSGLCVHGRHNRCRGAWGAAVCSCACHQPDPAARHCPTCTCTAEETAA